jgi:hypothetical protein
LNINVLVDKSRFGPRTSGTAGDVPCSLVRIGSPDDDRLRGKELEVFPGFEFPTGRLMSGMIFIQLAGSLVGWTGFTQRRAVN